MSGRRRRNFERNNVSNVPHGVPFVMLSIELLNSPGWRLGSINCRRLINFLMVEHMKHAGTENGRLLATYDQLITYGIGRRLVHDAISEAEALRLITVQRGGRRGFAESDTNKFTLTFLNTKNEYGQYESPTNDWEKIDEALARLIVVNYKKSRSRKQIQNTITKVKLHGARKEISLVHDNALEGRNIADISRSP